MCGFCNGERIRVAGYKDEGRAETISSMLRRLDGIDDKNGVQLMDGRIMRFDNSSGEYNPGMVYINYCPFCGRKIGEETIKP